MHCRFGDLAPEFRLKPYSDIGVLNLFVFCVDPAECNDFRYAWGTVMLNVERLGAIDKVREQFLGSGSSLFDSFGLPDKIRLLSA
jgi:hypothetical protein